MQIGIQEPPEEGRASKATEITPLPASVAVAETAAAVPVRTAAALTDVAGTVLSTRREATVLVLE